MSELRSLNGARRGAHWRLLTGVSVIALTAHIASTEAANAEDADRPVLWIELGGQLSLLSDPYETWVPSNIRPAIDHPVTGILGQRPSIGYDANARITIQPGDTDWHFSAAVRYGKARRGPKFAHDQTYKTHDNGQKYVPTTYAFTDMHKVEETHHVILDFQAGKDIGLGVFSPHARSTVNFGIRVAQFREQDDGTMTAQTNAPHKYSFANNFSAFVHNVSTFNGIGPSIAWNGSVPLAGSLENGLAFDLGANAAVLFGRQKARINTHTEENDFAGLTFVHTGFGTVPQAVFSQRTHSTLSTVRSRGVVIPNLGAFAGLSYRVGGRGKVALGYRADFFFGAMDGGLDSRKSEDVGFHGPFATISLGLGG